MEYVLWVGGALVFLFACWRLAVLIDPYDDLLDAVSPPEDEPDTW